MSSIHTCLFPHFIHLSLFTILSFWISIGKKKFLFRIFRGVALLLQLLLRVGASQWNPRWLHSSLSLVLWFFHSFVLSFFRSSFLLFFPFRYQMSDAANSNGKFKRKLAASICGCVSCSDALSRSDVLREETVIREGGGPIEWRGFFFHNKLSNKRTMLYCNGCKLGQVIPVTGLVLGLIDGAFISFIYHLSCSTILIIFFILTRRFRRNKRVFDETWKKIVSSKWCTTCVYCNFSVWLTLIRLYLVNFKYFHWIWAAGHQLNELIGRVFGFWLDVAILG